MLTIRAVSFKGRPLDRELLARFEEAGGTIGRGNVQVNGGATINGLSFSHPAFTGHATLTLAGGTSTWASGDIVLGGLGGSGNLIVGSGATLVQTGGGTLIGETIPVGSLQNNGTYRKLGPSLVSIGRPVFFNSGHRLSEAELVPLITRDALIGVAEPRAPVS